VTSWDLYYICVFFMFAFCVVVWNMFLLYSYMDIVIIFVAGYFLTLLHPGIVLRVRASVGLMLQVTTFTCFCDNIALLPALWTLKCFLLLCNIIVIYCLKYRIVEIKEYFVYVFILFLFIKDVIFLYVIHMFTLSSYLYYFHCVLHISTCMCPMFIMCCAQVDVSLLYFIAHICSLNHVLNACPVWPIYCKGQSLHFSLYTSLLSYWLLLRCFTCMCFCMIFVIYTLFYVGVFQYVGNFPDFISKVCKCGPFALFLLLFMLVCCVTFVYFLS
jgi:hypothetical protein